MNQEKESESPHAEKADEIKYDRENREGFDEYQRHPNNHHEEETRKELELVESDNQVQAKRVHPA